MTRSSTKQPKPFFFGGVTGGPLVTTPTKKGFGCFVLERVTINALGSGGLEFKPDGLVWTCIIRPEHLVDSGGSAEPERKRVAAPAAAAD